MEIKEELPKLTFEERAELAQALGLRYDAWDLQMIRDGQPGGKLARLREKALEADRRGETEEWP